MTSKRSAEPCDIEIIERTTNPRNDVIIPNEVRINGHPVLASGDDPVVVHEIAMTGRDVVRVTLTLFARRVTIAEEKA